MPGIGLASLCWFLVRVIPKPSRAAYPCQRAAMPIAAGFVGYLFSLFSSVFAFKKARHFLKNNRTGFAFLIMIIGLIAGIWHLNLSSEKGYGWTPTDPINTPVGTARGIFPGRVVWVHDPTATSWDGTTDYWWSGTYTNQTVISDMLSRSIRWLTETSADDDAWEALFCHFNLNHGKGNVGYASGEKIAIKLNLNNCDAHDNNENASYTTPQLVLALLDQLVNEACVAESDIACYDVIRYIPSTIYNPCHTAFPGVRFIDWTGGDGREKYTRDTGAVIHWSEDLTLEIGGGHPAYFPTCVTEAEYIINLGALKGHNLTGVTFCAKNGFGSFDADRDGVPYLYGPKAAGVHPYVAVHDFTWGAEWTFTGRDMGTYNALVDLMGHEDFGEKTLLFLIDGLYGAYSQSVKKESDYRKWTSAPFNTDWPSSILASQDIVAIESVALDLMNSEPQMTDNIYGNVDNYLHEASQADDPPSGTFYDPEDDGTALTSLGTHEHWNSPVDKCYSRNLGTGNGIELISDDPLQSVTVTIRVFLEGPYHSAADTLYASLEDAGWIPLESPYEEDPVTVGSIPQKAVDWVLVELRETAAGAAAASKSAFLRSDGIIVAENGITPFITLDTEDGDYYIVVRHRNHLAAMSRDPVSLE